MFKILTLFPATHKITLINSVVKITPFPSLFSPSKTKLSLRLDFGVKNFTFSLSLSRKPSGEVSHSDTCGLREAIDDSEQEAVTGFEPNIDSSLVRTGVVKPEFDALRLPGLQIASFMMLSLS